MEEGLEDDKEEGSDQIQRQTTKPENKLSISPSPTNNNELQVHNNKNNINRIPMPDFEK